MQNNNYTHDFLDLRTHRFLERETRIEPGLETTVEGVQGERDRVSSVKIECSSFIEGCLTPSSRVVIDMPPADPGSVRTFLSAAG